jgi:hypothetical protein
MGLQTSVSNCTVYYQGRVLAMSQALHDVISVMNLLQEMREQNFKVVCIEPYVYCKVFEDNAGALELARLPKLRPRTKHINVCYHHFREHVQLVLILAGSVCNIWDFFLVHSYVRVGLYQCSTVTYCRLVLKNKKLKKMLRYGYNKNSYHPILWKFIAGSRRVLATAVDDW